MITMKHTTYFALKKLSKSLWHLRTKIGGIKILRPPPPDHSEIIFNTVIFGVKNVKRMKMESNNYFFYKFPFFNSGHKNSILYKEIYCINIMFVIVLINNYEQYYWNNIFTIFTNFYNQ